jgi:hypothetical protein
VETGNLTVSLDSEHAKDLLVGETITYNLVATSINAPAKGDLVTGSVVIKQLHAVTIPPPQDEEFFLSPGDPVPIVMDFTNDGNGVELVTPELVVPEDWDWEYEGGDISIEIGGTRTAQLKVLTPSNALQGTHTVTVMAVSNGKALDSYDLTFIVDWAPSISVRLDGASDRNLTRGFELAYEFRVTNTGNAPDTVSVVVERLTRGLTADIIPESVNLGVDDVGTFTIVFNASKDAELLIGTYDIRFRFAEETKFTLTSVNITIKLASGGGPSGPDDDDDDKGSINFGAIIILVAIVAVAAAAVVAVALMSRSKRSSRQDEEAFFMGKEEPQVPDYLGEEEAKRPLPPPPPPRVGEPDGLPDPGMDAAPIPVTTSVSGGASCPECGNAMEPIGPGSPGKYCPMCGHKEGEG